MTYQYFVASRYRNKEIVLDLVRKLRENGKTVYCFIESPASTKHVGSVESNPEEVMKTFESISNWQNDKRVKEVFETDMTALRNSENLILLLPAGKSAHVESGAAYGMNKNCIVIGEQKETESLYLIFNEFYPDIDSFLESIS